MHAATLTLAFVLAGADPGVPAAAPQTYQRFTLDPTVLPILERQREAEIIRLRARIQFESSDSSQSTWISDPYGDGSGSTGRRRSSRRSARARLAEAQNRRKPWTPSTSVFEVEDGQIVRFNHPLSFVRKVDSDVAVLDADGQPILLIGGITEFVRGGVSKRSNATFRVRGFRVLPALSTQEILVLEHINLEPYYHSSHPANTPIPILDDEQKAANALALAKRVLDAGKRDRARARLHKIVHDFPRTAATSEAKTLLVALQKGNQPASQSDSLLAASP